MNQIRKNLWPTLFIFFSTFFLATVQGKPIKIGFLLNSLQEKRFQKDKHYSEDEAKRLGAEILFKFSHDSESEQNEQLQNLITKGVDVVIIRPVNPANASSWVALANKHHIPLIAYDRLIENSLYDLYVTQDSQQIGRLQATAAVKATGEKGHYLILMGPSEDRTNQAISNGVKEVLKKYPHIKIDLEKNHEEQFATEAKKTIANALINNKGQIDAILATQSDMADGAIQAILDYDKKLAGKIFVAGAGANADLTSIKNIVKGYQQLAVLVDQKFLAEKSVQMAVNLANKNKMLLSTESVFNGKTHILVVKTPVFAITKSNLDELIIKSGIYSHPEVYEK